MSNRRASWVRSKRSGLSGEQGFTILVTLTLVGERVEIDVFDDRHMEVSRFTGNEGVVAGADLVKQIIAENRE